MLKIRNKQTKLLVRVPLKRKEKKKLTVFSKKTSNLFTYHDQDFLLLTCENGICEIVVWM